jgi:hypothetical protein
MARIDRLKLWLFHDSMGGGAWPFLVRGLICLVNSDNERDLGLPVGAAQRHLLALGAIAPLGETTCV